MQGFPARGIIATREALTSMTALSCQPLRGNLWELQFFFNLYLYVEKVMKKIKAIMSNGLVLKKIIA